MSQIFWFSGTGNSLYAAKVLAASLGEASLYAMCSGVPEEAVGGEGETIGFVFPSYYGNLPRAVRRFVEDLKIEPGTYIFGVVTMGGVGQGSVAALKEALDQKGVRLSFGRGILMPANYVIKYNPADPDKSGEKLNKADERIRRAASEIANWAQSVRKFRFTADNLYKNIDALDAGFFAGESCAGCGRCEKICPVGNIRMVNGKPDWLRHCEHCVACISWCPARAIQYERRTKSRRRYRNPRIHADEMLLD